MEFTKELEGATIIGLPTGNNARMRGTTEPIKFEVVKVKRKYVEMKRGGSIITDNYCPKSGATQSAINSGFGGNAGYRFFRDMKEYKHWEMRQTYVKNIEKMARDFGLGRKLDNLNDSDLKTVENILLKVCD